MTSEEIPALHVLNAHATASAILGSLNVYALVFNVSTVADFVFAVASSTMSSGAVFVPAWVLT